MQLESHNIRIPAVAEPMQLDPGPDDTEQNEGEASGPAAAAPLHPLIDMDAATQLITPPTASWPRHTAERPEAESGVHQAAAAAPSQAEPGDAQQWATGKASQQDVPVQPLAPTRATRRATGRRKRTPPDH